MNPFKLPSGIKGQVLDRVLRVESCELPLSDVLELCRLCLISWPLAENDERLKFMDELQGSIVKEDTQTGLRWIALNVLKSVSLRKWRSRHRAA